MNEIEKKQMAWIQRNLDPRLPKHLESDWEIVQTEDAKIGDRVYNPITDTFGDVIDHMNDMWGKEISCQVDNGPCLLLRPYSHARDIMKLPDHMDIAFDMGIDEGTQSVKSIIGTENGTIKSVELFDPPEVPTERLLRIEEFKKILYSNRKRAHTYIKDTLDRWMNEALLIDGPVVFPINKTEMVFKFWPLDTQPKCKVFRQFRFPRSKKARIQKKWRKNPCNFRLINRPYNPLFGVTA